MSEAEASEKGQTKHKLIKAMGGAEREDGMGDGGIGDGGRAGGRAGGREGGEEERESGETKGG